MRVERKQIECVYLLAFPNTNNNRQIGETCKSALLAFPVLHKSFVLKETVGVTINSDLLCLSICLFLLQPIAIICILLLRKANILAKIR